MSRLLLLPVLMTMCALTSCGLSIGPQVKETAVLVHDGQPGVVVGNVSVRVQFEKAGGEQFVDQKIGGWMVMPKPHFDALMTRLKKLESDLARDKVDVDVKPGVKP